MLHLPGPADLRRVLDSPAVRLYQPDPNDLPLKDRDPDPGLFGPGSVAWRVAKEPLLILGGGRALLLQAAHPLVAQGAIDHSSYATDPYGRLERTLEWVTMVTFGTTAEAHAACRLVNRLHHPVRGRLPQGHHNSGLPERASYWGKDPQLLRWVHATFVDTMLTAHDAFVGGLTDRDRDDFVREWHAVALLMGVPRPLLWRNYAELRRYMADEIVAGRVLPARGSRTVAQTVLHPPLQSPALQPLWYVMEFLMTGLLPSIIREGYGLQWSGAHAAAHRGLALWLRSTRPALPRRMRDSPVYELAMRRTAGEWTQAA